MVLLLGMRLVTEGRGSNSHRGIFIRDMIMVGKGVRGGVEVEIRGQVRVRVLALDRAGMRVQGLGERVGGEWDKAVLDWKITKSTDERCREEDFRFAGRLEPSFWLSYTRLWKPAPFIACITYTAVVSDLSRTRWGWLILLATAKNGSLMAMPRLR